MKRKTITLPNLIVKALNDWRAHKGLKEGYIPTFTEAVVHHLHKALDIK